VKVAYARSSTWGTAASVTRQVLLASSEGLDDAPVLSDDEAFGQNFLGEAQVSQRAAVNTELVAQARYEDLDSWIAGACGSSAAPVVVSSQATNSLVAASHVITMADELTHFFTLAIDTPQYVQELTSFKVRGFSMNVGDNGAMQMRFPIVGSRVKYDSAVNVSSTVQAATQATIGHRLFRKDGRIRMNLQSAGALGASDILDKVREFSFTYNRPLAGEDFVFNQDYIIEPDDDGFAELMLEMTFPRMNTASANSLAVSLGDGKVFKADVVFTGTYINSTTQRSLTLEMPALQIYAFRAPVVGHQQVRPVAQFRMKRAQTAPTGMAFTNPFRITLVNGNSVNLLT
jgi:hypothetical protein